MISQLRSWCLCTSRAGALLSASILAALFFCSQLQALDEKEKAKEEEAQREQQLKNMKRSAAQHLVSPAGNAKRQFKLHETAIIRFSNPLSGCKDGAMYIWLDHGRPQAILKLYTYDNEYYSHEWQSLSEDELVVEREGKTIWNPTEPGITFRECGDAPKPAESAAERLRQMKSLAGKFSTTYTDVPRDSKPVEMRLLTQPLYRYETGNDPNCLDGAIFAFAITTAPPAILLFEARKVGESHKWHYAFARMATGATVAKIGEKEVFSVEKYDFRKDAKNENKTFLLLPRQPVPKE
jgi:hypothetical protein